MSFGEVGSLTRGGFGVGEIVRIDFTEPLDNAIIHLSSTNGGGNEFSLRVVSVDANGFNFVLEEWEDEDGPHPATETINWIAVEPGTHVMEDGRVIEAGTTIASTTTSSVALNGSYTDTPVILTNVMSQNETDVVDSDPSNVTTSGFDVTLQEGSLVDGVNNGETVGYIAISTDTTSTDSFSSVQDGLNSGNNDFALGGTLTNGAVFAETQTLNEAGSGNVAIAANDIDGSNANVTMRFDEETGDGNSAHGNESVGLVGLEIGLILCFAADTMIETTEGQQRCADLAPGDLVVGADGKEKPLRQVLRRDLGWVELATNPRLWPVRIAAGALGQDLPRRDLLVSRQHRMLVSSRIAERMFGT
ncbi:MAG: Hint domain-containing protein, partial [Pseudomonadota bacterium]